MTMLTIGTQAPNFTLPDRNGVLHSLSDVETDFTVVYFYPKDDTPGCTIEAVEMSEALPAFRKQGVSVFGVSGGDNKSKSKFCEKHKLEVTLLTDQEFETAIAFRAYGDKKFMGRSFKGVFRHTYILDKSKVVLRVFPSVKSQGHADELLKAIKELEKELNSTPKTKAKIPMKGAGKKFLP